MIKIEFNDYDELLYFIRSHTPIAIKPTRKSKTTLVGPFTSVNAFEVVTKAIADVIVENCSKSDISWRTLDINSCAVLIKSMPLSQAIQLMKSEITGQPQTTVVKGELVVAYVPYL